VVLCVVVSLLIIGTVVAAVVMAVRRSHFSYETPSGFARTTPKAQGPSAVVMASPSPVQPDQRMQLSVTEEIEDDDDGIKARQMLLAKYNAMHEDATPALPDTKIHGRTVQEISDTLTNRQDAALPPLNALRRNQDLMRGNFADYDRLKWLLYSKEMKNVLPWLPLNMPEIPREGLDYNDEERSSFVFSTQPNIASMN
jgi:hypothetical protein